MVGFLGGDGEPGLLDAPGVGPDRVASFYQAAAGFYHRAPWRKLGDERAVMVQCDVYESGPWYAVVMGQAGFTYGLALYEDLGLLRKLWSRDIPDERAVRETVSLSVTFDDEAGSRIADVDAADRYGWEVAAPEAYPWVCRKEKGMATRPPLAWELRLLEACLRRDPRLRLPPRSRRSEPTQDEGADIVRRADPGPVVGRGRVSKP